MELGVCYYPEHWPEDIWAQDAQRMSAMGIRWVRIAEFAWSRIEPLPGQFQWDWLDRAIEALHQYQLKVVMCTPTATPPKWLVDQMPDMIAVDPQGKLRKFGSRRHYCFSFSGYLAEAKRISTEVAKRYGKHPAVQAWQTDNEYGCHDTTLSYSVAALHGFRKWLQAKYKDVKQLNQAWGTVFWSQEYQSFSEVDLPNLTVTEANPSHRLDFQRYSSDAVRVFNQAQIAILRQHSPNRPISHNFMGFYTEFDHHDVAQDLDVATWDSYPLGFTQNFFFSDAEKAHYAQTGHPDIPSFHHDLYRGMCASRHPDAPAHGRWWVMEQQPGPVNWAQWNPAPHDGMVRLWSWQAFAHGAEIVSYFRWRQAPFAQEQMHTGLLLPDSSINQGGIEAAQVTQDLTMLAQRVNLSQLAIRNKVALLFDYPSLWMTQLQPQGKDQDAMAQCFRLYSAMRQLGWDVDIVSSHAALDGYQLIVLGIATHINAELGKKLRASAAHVVCPARTASKTADLHIPAGLPPCDADTNLHDWLGIKVLRVASYPPHIALGEVTFGKTAHPVHSWLEDLELHGAQVTHHLDNGRPFITHHQRAWYIAGGMSSDAAWKDLFQHIGAYAGLAVTELPEDIRVSRIGQLQVVCNFGNQVSTWRTAEHANATLVVGDPDIAAHSVQIWQLHSP